MAITVPTVLVLGAGASASYGFPLGPQLRDTIAEHSANFIVQNALRPHGYAPTQVKAFHKALIHSGYSSIDAFLEAEPSFASLGKLLITYALLPAERPERLFPPKAPKAHWYQYLVSLLEVGKPGWDKNRLTVLTFNYDRSLEHYLATVIAQRYRTIVPNAAKRLKRIEIIHLHGQLGSYPGLGGTSVPFGHTDATRSEIEAAASRIRIISEPTDLAPFRKAGKLISKARRLIFLGFGYAPESMRRLEDFTSSIPSIVAGTSKGMSYLDWRKVTARHFTGRWSKRSRKSILDYLRSDMDLTYNPDPGVE